MNAYKKIIDALSDRDESKRRAAYETLSNARVLRGSVFLYPVYLVCGALIGFFISFGANALVRVSILGVIGFVVSGALFMEYIRVKKILNAVVVLVIKAEDERRYSMVDSIPVVNPKST